MGFHGKWKVSLDTLTLLHLYMSKLHDCVGLEDPQHSLTDHKWACTTWCQLVTWMHALMRAKPLLTLQQKTIAKWQSVNLSSSERMPSLLTDMETHHCCLLQRMATYKYFVLWPILVPQWISATDMKRQPYTSLQRPGTRKLLLSWPRMDHRSTHLTLLD